MSHPVVVDSSESSAHRRMSWAAVAEPVLLVWQPIVFFGHVLISPRAHIPYDIEAFHLPLISYIAQSVRAGVAPFWDPYSYGGVPIHADLTAQLYYPFSWLAIFAANHTGRGLFYWIEVLIPLHMILAGLFAFWLLRRMGLRLAGAFLGATVYQLGGYFASQAQHLGAVCCGAWLPLAVLAVFEMRQRIRPRWIAVLALAVAMSILSGFMATTVVVGGAVLLTMGALLVLREAGWRSIPATAAGFVIGIMISTVELAPLWQLTQVSIASLRANWFLNGGGLPLESLVSLVIPNYYHIFEGTTSAYKLPYNFTFMYVYCGLATVVLLVLAPFLGRARGRVFLVLTLLSALWMLGEHTPVYHSIYVHLPKLVRGALYSEEALMAFCFFAGVTAALVLDRIGKRLPQAALWAVALFNAYDLMHTGADRPMNSADRGYKQLDSENRIGNSKDLPDKLRELLNRTYPPTRVDYMDRLLQKSVLGADMLRLPTADGDNPFMLRRILYLRRLFCGGNWWERTLPVDRPGSPLVSMLNIGWLVKGSPLAEAEVRQAGLEDKGTLEGVALYRNPRALPRFFLAPRIRRSPDEAASFQMLAQSGFDPAAEAIVEGVAADRSGLATAPVNVKLYTPNRIQLAVMTSGPAFLASSEPMYPGWEAKVNGKVQPVLMTNGAFRGLALGPGANEVVMEYRPPHFRLYLFFSTMLALATAIVAIRGERSRRKKDGVAEAASWRWSGAAQAAPEQRLRRWLADATIAIWRGRVTLGWLLLFVPTIVLFYWKILLTRQFSLLTEAEGVNQAYSWLRFWVSSIRHGVLPLWDPYTLSGHSFAGEMQTAAFYPLHLLLALFPLNQHLVLSTYLYHACWAGAHLLGACFLFLLVREFGLSRFAAYVAALCFSLSGFISWMAWPHMLESSIWLPLIFLAFLRAIRADNVRRLVRNASLGGLALGMSILAGGLHVVIMQTIVVLSAGVFYAAAGGSKGQTGAPRSWRAATVAGVIMSVGLTAGAVQLLPSLEYSSHALRFLGAPGAFPANQKIPYQYLNDALWPHGILRFLFPAAFNASVGVGNASAGVGEVPNPYLGVFPLLAAIIGIRKNWGYAWVRYLTGLAVAAVLYSFGPLSWLHGVLYAIAPELWLAREAPRMLYLADFSLAILAGFGIDTLFSRGREATWEGLNRALLGLVIVCAVCLFVPAVLGKPEISPWISLSLVLVFFSYGLFRSILHGNSGALAKVLVAGLVLFDLAAFDWTTASVLEVRKHGIDHLARNLSLEGAGNFLKAQPDFFRVQVVAEPQPNMGDLFGIPTTSGGGVTLPTEYARIMENRDLLNVRYVVKPASAPDPGPVYQDAAWKVYENPGSRPRAWLVHETIADSPGKSPAAFDPGRTALIYTPIPDTIEPAAHADRETVAISAYTANRIELKVHAETRGLLVLSETYYPGWHASVNGTAALIQRVDGDLRGVVVPPGNNQVILDYTPWSVYGGGLLTLFAFFGTAYYASRIKG